MGQKTNPNIFRLSKTGDWKSKYIEKKTNELALYTSKDLEVKNFLKKFFKQHGLLVKECRLNHTSNSATIHLTYQQNLHSTYLINDINKSQQIKVVKTNTNRKKIPKNLIETIRKISEYNNLHYKKEIKFSNQSTIMAGGKKLEQRSTKSSLREINSKNRNDILEVFKNYYKTNNDLNSRKNLSIPKQIRLKKLERLKLLNYYKKYLQIKKNNKINEIKSNSFLNRLFESISKFFGEKTEIRLIIKPLNSNVKIILNDKQHNLLKKKIARLRKYQRNEFFKEGVNSTFSSVNQKNSSRLIAEFICENIQKLKRHNFFLRFLKNLLDIFIAKKLSSTIQGIKIKVKGRFNGAPRAKHKIIQIGKHMPILALKSRIDYTETTAYTSNGTFGIKVWVCQK